MPVSLLTLVTTVKKKKELYLDIEKPDYSGCTFWAPWIFTWCLTYIYVWIAIPFNNREYSVLQYIIINLYL